MSLVLTASPIHMDHNDRHPRQSNNAGPRHPQQQQQHHHHHHPQQRSPTEYAPKAARHSTSPATTYERPTSASSRGSAQTEVFRGQPLQQQQVSSDYPPRLYGDSSSVRPETVSSPQVTNNDYSPPVMTVSPSVQQRPQSHHRLPSLQTILSPPEERSRTPPTTGYSRQSEYANGHAHGHHASYQPPPFPQQQQQQPSYPSSPPNSSSGPSSQPSTAAPVSRPVEIPPYGGPFHQPGPPADHQSGRWPISSDKPNYVHDKHAGTSSYAGPTQLSRWSASMGDYRSSHGHSHHPSSMNNHHHPPPPLPPPPPPASVQLHHQHHPNPISSMPGSNVSASSHTRSNSDHSRPGRSSSPRDIHSSSRDAVTSGDPLLLRVNDPPGPTLSTSSSSPVAPAKYVGIQASNNGLWHLYEDGTTCRAEIEGEPVNPDWGVTKAGKPRKRLAQACISCREKKIKCEPGYPKCNQCQKLGRECKRSSAARTSPDTSVLSKIHEKEDQASDLQMMANPPDDDTSPERSSSPLKRGSMTEKSHHHYHQGSKPHSSFYGYHEGDVKMETTSPIKPGSPDTRPPKRARVSTENVSYYEYDSRRDMMDIDYESNSKINIDRIKSRLIMESDPHEVIPDLCLRLVESAYINNTETSVYSLFPRVPFMAWVKGSSRDRDERILLYAIMALGFAFEYHAEPWIQLIGSHVVDVATAAVNERFAQGRNTPQLAQARLFLHLYNVARGKHHVAWDHLAAACKILMSLHMNKESGILSHSYSTFEASLERTQAEETRRRTFWLAYIYNCYSGFYRGRVTLLHDSDIFLRLPNVEQDFIGPCSYTGPPFDGGQVNWSWAHAPAAAKPLTGNMATLVEIASIWNAVFGHAYQSTNKAKLENAESYERFYDATKQRLEDWRKRLAPEMQSSSANLSKSHEQGRFAAYFNIHTMHYATAITLARFGPVENLSSDIIRRNIFEARRHAHQFLSLINTVCREQLAGGKRNTDVQTSLCNPFLSYCVLAACDVACSGGKTATLRPNLIPDLSNVSRLLNEVGRLWSIAKQHHEAINERLCEVSAQGPDNDTQGTWRIEKPFSGSSWPLSYDIVYHSSHDLFHEAVTEATIPAPATASLSATR